MAAAFRLTGGKLSARSRRISLSLTGPDSHPDIARSASTLYVGPRPTDRKLPHAVVDAGAAIDWSSLSELADRGWPRILLYEGADTSIFAWLAGRPVQKLVWNPTAPAEVDATGLAVQDLTLETHEHRVAIALPPAIRFSIRGAAELVEPSHSGKGSGLHLHFWEGTPVSVYDSLAQLTELTVSSDRAPNDVSPAVKYGEVTALGLMGGTPVQLGALADLKKLTRLRIHEVWDLAGLPTLGSWPELEHVKAHNLAKADGETLKAAGREHPHIEVEVSGLRSPEWIAENGTSPFRSWKKSKRETANAAWFALQASIGPDADSASIEHAVTAFVDALNELHAQPRQSLDTADREDAAAAVDEAVPQRLRGEALDLFARLRSF